MHTDFFRRALAGGMAGVGFWTSVYPVDVVKSRIQVIVFSLVNNYFVFTGRMHAVIWFTCFTHVVMHV